MDFPSFSFICAIFLLVLFSLLRLSGDVAIAESEEVSFLGITAKVGPQSLSYIRVWVGIAGYTQVFQVKDCYI